MVYVPSLWRNLLSTKAVTSYGASVEFWKENCLIWNSQGHIVAEALLSPEGLYNLTQRAENALSLVTQPNALSEYELWHKRLSHISEDHLKLMFSGTATGINIMSFSMDKCVACAKDKQHKVAQGKEPGRRASAPFELMHTDLGKMINIPSLGGAKFFSPVFAINHGSPSCGFWNTRVVLPKNYLNSLPWLKHNLVFQSKQSD